MRSGPRAALAGWPTHHQELLLRAALADSDTASRAWDEVGSDLDFENLDGDSLWLVALASRRLGSPGDLSGRIAGLTRRTWYGNRLLVQAVEEAVAALCARGFGCVVLDELALLVESYGDLASRSIPSAALWARGPSGSAAWEALASAGWTRSWTGADLLYAPAERVHLVHRDGHRCWVLRERRQEPSARARHVLDDVWLRAGAPGPRAGGAPGRRGHDGPVLATLDAADQLVRSAVEGLRWQGRPAAAWAADIATLVRAHPELDWGRVVARCNAWAVALPTLTALTYVAEVCGVATAPEAVAALRTGAARPGEVLALRVTGRRRADPEAVPVAIAGALRRMHGASGWRDAMRFLAALWDVEHPWRTPAVAAKKAWRRLRVRRPVDALTGSEAVAVSSRTGGRSPRL